MTDAAQERVDEQTNAERHKKAVREWSDDELTRAARNQAGRLDEAGQFGVADLLYELTRRLRARQREEGDVDTRTIGLALNDIRSIVRQDWTWTTELQRHYDLAMDALRVEPPTEQEQDDGPVDMDRVIEIARYNAANDVGVGPSYVSHLLAYIDDLEADATPQREGGSCRICTRPTDGVTLCRYCDRMMGHLEGEREPVADLEACREAYDALSRQHAEFRRSIRSELWRFWPNNLGVGNDEIVRAVRRAVDEALDTEPPAEPDLDELTPRCPACRETMHDCECNPYMDTEESDGR